MTAFANWAKHALRITNPAIVIAILLIAAALTSWRPRWARRWLLAIALVAAFLSSPAGSLLLVRILAHGYGHVNSAADAPGAGAIVVIGGGMNEVREGDDVLPYPNEETALRIVEGARVFRALGRQPIVVASGGRTEAGQTFGEGALIAMQLQFLGVPSDHIVVEQDSKTTHDQAMFVTRLLSERGIRRIVLVTSPQHMLRSDLAFRAQGADVVPSISLVRSEHEWVPPFYQLGNEWLHISSDAVYDYAGLAYYWLKGWLRP